MAATPAVVPMPRWSTAIGCAKAVLAIIVLAFTSAAAGVWGAGYTAFGFALFTSSASLLMFAYYYLALCWRPELYSRWVVLSLELFGTVFWLATFTLLAQWTAVYNGNGYWYGDEDSYGFWNAPYSPGEVGFKLARKTVTRRDEGNKYHAGVGLAGAAAGLGAFEFVLYAITLVVFGISLHKQRKLSSPNQGLGLAQTCAADTGMATNGTAPASKGKEGEPSAV